MKKPHLVFGLLLLSWGCGSNPGQPAKTTIGIRSAPTSLQERLASRELRRYIYLRTGAQADISEDGNRAEVPAQIIVGIKNQPLLNPYLSDAALLQRVAALEPQQYILKTVATPEGKALLIAGGDPIGALYGAYAFIEHLGVRFYLEGDVVPDGKIAWAVPDLDETGRPVFNLRGLNPWGSHPFGFDQWNADDYKAVISQLLKMRMNFIGMHCYLTSPYDEPTVWVGEKEDVLPDGTVKAAYPARYYNTFWKGIWGPMLPGKTGDYAFGASMLFENDAWGPDSMKGFWPTPRKPEDRNELFNRVGRQFNEAFGFARRLGVKTALGTEAPLKNFVPEEIAGRLRAKGKNPSDPAVLRDLYQGIFERIKRTHPLDYYWIWTPEDWTWNGNSLSEMKQTVEDVNIALQALKDVGAPFRLATSGWVLGPQGDRAAFDAVLPKDVSMAALSQNVGHYPIDPAYANIKGRDKWAIPWLEADNYHGLAALQLFAGRTIYDAVTARQYGCTGWMGVFWRTREMGPNVAALAQSGWESPGLPPYASLETTRDAKSPDFGNLGSRTVPVRDFYRDFARASFGPEAGEDIASVFSSLDGKVPVSVAFHCPSGSLAADPTLWEKAAVSYGFVDEMERLRPRVKGVGSLERFDFWLNTFRYHRLLAKIRCSLGSFEAVMKEVQKKKGFENQRNAALAEVLPLYRKMAAEYEELASLCLKAVTTNGGLATIVNLQQARDFWPLVIENPGRRLADLLGEPLPADAVPARVYRGDNRMFMTTVRSCLLDDEPLDLKVSVLSKFSPRKISLLWRTLGGSAYSQKPLVHRARGIYAASLAPQDIGGKDFEYYVEAEFEGREAVRYPVTATDLNHTVVVLKR
jgi:hypothetical protein